MRQPANPYMTSAVRGPGRRGKWISWSSEGCPHFQFPTPGMSPRPAHCSGRPPGPPRVTQPEKPEPRLSRASGHRKSKNRKRQCAVVGWKPSDLGELRRTGDRSQQWLAGGPSVPPPPPAATQFPQTDTHWSPRKGRVAQASPPGPLEAGPPQAERTKGRPNSAGPRRPLHFPS